MSDHRFNPQSIAKAQGKTMVRATDLGDGVALVGFELQPIIPAPGSCDCGGEQLAAADGVDSPAHSKSCATNEPPTVAVGIFAIGGRASPLSLNVELRAVLVAELGRIPTANLKRMLSEEPAAQAEEAVPQ